MVYKYHGLAVTIGYLKKEYLSITRLYITEFNKENQGMLTIICHIYSMPVLVKEWYFIFKLVWIF